MSSTFPDSECVGLVIDGRFRLLRWLGGTEHSSVFLTELADDPPRKAAIKLVAANDAIGTQWATARTLSHPSLVRFFHFGRCEIDGEKLLYGVTEYAEEVLSEIIAERPLTVPEIEEMLAPILDALQYLQSRGLVHGGLTPSNIMAVGDSLKLSADGLETAGERGKRSRLSGDFDAPEMGAGTMSTAMDVWSLGMVLVKALTQETPDWNRESGGEPVVPAAVPEPFSAIARECLRVIPTRRCTLADINARLTPAPAAEPVVKARETVRSRRLVTMVALAVLVVGVVIAAVDLSSHHTQTPHAAATQNSVASPATSDAPPPVTEKPSVEPSTVKGAVTHQVMPEAPQAAMETIQGHVKLVIRVDVDEVGNVSDATIDSQGPSRYFAEFALKAAREWKFRPAEKDGSAVASTWVLHFVFERSGVEVTPVEVRP